VDYHLTLQQNKFNDILFQSNGLVFNYFKWFRKI